MEKKTVFLTSKKKDLDMSGPEGGVNKMEKKKESVVPMLVFLITLVIGMIILLRSILFSG